MGQSAWYSKYLTRGLLGEVQNVSFVILSNIAVSNTTVTALLESINLKVTMG